MPWKVSDAPTAYLHAMLRAIVGIEIPVQRWVGKNRPARTAAQPIGAAWPPGFAPWAAREAVAAAALVPQDPTGVCDMTAGPLDATVAGLSGARPGACSCGGAVDGGHLAAARLCGWKTLAVAYKTFYETTFARRRLPARPGSACKAEDRIHAWAAKVDGQLVGVAHLFHSSTWAQDGATCGTCQAESARGQGRGARAH